MEDKLFTDICRIDNLKIRNKNLLNQLSGDELLYLHLHLTMDEEVEKMLGNFSFPLNQDDFELAKKRINLKKIKRELLIQDILDILKEDEGIEDSKWFRIDIFKNPDDAVNYNAFYLLFYNLMIRQVASEFKDLRIDNIGEYASKLLEYKSQDKAEYDCIKSVCALCLSDKLFEILNAVEEIKEIRKSREKIDETILELQRVFALCIHNNYTLICKETIDDLNKDSILLKNQIKKGNIQLEERNQKIKDLKENVRMLNKQIKDYQKIQGISVLEDGIKKIQERLKSIEENNLSLNKEIKSNKEDIIRKTYENQINNYMTLITDLKKELSLKNSECKELKKNLDMHETNIEDNFIEHVKANGLSLKVKEFLNPFFDKEENLLEAYLKGDFVIPEDVEKDSEMILEESAAKIDRKIGYVSIENDKHYVTFVNGVTEEIIDLSDKIFLAEGQFIVVDENSKFLKTTLSKYEDNGISIKSLRLGTVESTEPLRVRVGFEYISPTHLNDFNGVYRVNQVVGLNDCNQIVRAFRVARFNADTAMKSIKARKLDVYYVLDTFSHGLYKLRNIETDVEDIYNLEVGEFEIVKHTIVFVKDNVVVNALSQGKFYTASSYYGSKTVHGPIEIINGDVMITKQSGEVAIVKNIPENNNLDDGDVVAVDEFNNYLYYSPTDKVYVEKSVLRKTPRQIVNVSNDKKPLELKGEVAIVGNPLYKNGYIMSFYKYGYKVNMLHGYDASINKIIQTAKNSEAIIVNTSYCSHDNFWQIKDEVKGGALRGVKYIFTQEDGANQLLNKLKELETHDEVAISN